MMFVLLIAVAASQLTIVPNTGACDYIANQCIGIGAQCIGTENAIAASILSTYSIDGTMSVPNTVAAFPFAMATVGTSPLPIAALYECECTNQANNACDWKSASAVADATSVCVSDATCKATWETVVTTTTAMGCTWDAAASANLLQFPSTTANTMDQFCTMFSVIMGTLNTQAVNLFTTLLAHAPGMEAASNIMNYCQLLGDVANSAQACLGDTVTNCANVWADIEKTTSSKGVKWQDTSLGLKTPVAEARASILALNPDFPTGTQQDTKEYCKVFAYAMAQNNIRAVHLLMTLNANVMAPGVGDDISTQCNKGMQMMFLGVVLGTGFGMMFLTLMGVCIYNKMCKSKN